MAGGIITSLRVGQEYANLILERGPVAPLPDLSEELQGILNRLPMELQQRFTVARTRASANLVAAGEKDMHDLERIQTRGYAYVRIRDDHADAYEPVPPVTKVRGFHVGETYINVLRTMGDATRVCGVAEGLVNRLPVELRKSFRGLQRRLAARLVENNRLLQHYDFCGQLFIPVYNGEEEEEEGEEEEEEVQQQDPVVEHQEPVVAEEVQQQEPVVEEEVQQQEAIVEQAPAAGARRRNMPDVWAPATNLPNKRARKDNPRYASGSGKPEGKK